MPAHEIFEVAIGIIGIGYVFIVIHSRSELNQLIRNQADSIYKVMYCRGLYYND